jgi:hypothetical protein
LENWQNALELQKRAHSLLDRFPVREEREFQSTAHQCFNFELAIPPEAGFVWQELKNDACFYSDLTFKSIHQPDQDIKKLYVIISDSDSLLTSKNTIHSFFYTVRFHRVHFGLMDGHQLARSSVGIFDQMRGRYGAQ